jgi:hypothetical protein
MVWYKYTVLSKELMSPPSGKMGNSDSTFSEDEESTFFQNAGKFLPKYMTSDPRERYSLQSAP